MNNTEKLATYGMQHNRRTEHHFYAEIVTDLTSWNSERKDT